MKKNSFKRFLAITLAAATALTFAPVSTLGLSGVIEAQAAEPAPSDGDSLENGKEYANPGSDVTAVTVAVEPGKTFSFTVDTASAVVGSGTERDSKGNNVFSWEAKGDGTTTKTYVTIKGITAGSGKITTAIGSIKPVAVTVASIGTSSKLELDNSDINYTPNDGSSNVEFLYTIKDAATANTNVETKILDKDNKDVTSDFTVTTTGVKTIDYDSETKTQKDPITVAWNANQPVGKYILKVNTKADGDTPVTCDFYVVNKDASTATDAQASDVSVNAGSTVTVPVTFTGATDYDQFKIKAEDAKSTDKKLAAENAQLSFIKDNKANVKFTVPADAAGEYTFSFTTADNGARTIGTDTFTVTVVGAKLTVSAKDLVVNGDKQIFSATTPGATDKYKVAIKDADGNPVTDSFNIYTVSGGNATSTLFTNDGTTAATNKDASFAVKAPTGVTAGTYTVIVTDVEHHVAGVADPTALATFKVTASGTDNGNTDNTKTTAVNSDIFGGVTTSILATDKTNYSLVNSNATFKLGDKSYTADQLNWYLTTAPNSTPENMGFTQGEAVIDASGATTVGKLDIHVNNATIFAANASGKAYVEGVYKSGASNTIVYSHVLKVKAEDKMVTKTYDAGTISTNLDSVNKRPLSNSFLDSTTFIGTNNKFLDGSNSTLGESVSAGRNFDVTFVDATGSDKTAKGSSIQSNNTITSNGVYYEKYYVVYTDTTEANATFVAEITVNVSVNAGPVVEVREGNFVYSNTTGAKDDTKVIDLDLAKNKTFDVKAHTYSNKDNTSYSYSIDTQNVTEKDGVITAVKEGTAIVTITPKADGVEGPKVYIFVRVSKNPADSIEVTGKDGDKATVLTTRQYNGNSSNLKSEFALAAAQVGYVQVEVTGKEITDVKEALTVKGAGKLTYALATGKDIHGESVDAKTGEITISHDYLNKCDKAGADPAYVFAVKVVSSETSTSALTTGYFYVVVDYKDAKVNGLEDSYDVGTSLTETLAPSWLNLGLEKADGPIHVSSNADVYTDVLDKDNDLDDSKLYTDDEQNAFVWGGDNRVERATVAGKTEHVLVYSYDTDHKVGFTAKVVTLKSVEGKHNYVTKIENVATGKTLYETGSAVSGASITIDKATVVKVTVANAPVASLNPKYDPAFTITGTDDGFNYNTFNLFVAATENPKTYEITLIPSQEGTQIVPITPTQGRLSATDYSLVGTEDFKLAVKYDASAATTKPAKVTGVKVSNKKGAKVTVSFKKVTTAPTIRYYVQKKIGKKTSGKSIGSTKTTLSVKKGATVKVRVKAYYYDENGSKHVGAYSAWKTLKTDKK